MKAPALALLTLALALPAAAQGCVGTTCTADDGAAPCASDASQPTDAGAPGDSSADGPRTQHDGGDAGDTGGVSPY